MHPEHAFYHGRTILPQLLWPLGITLATQSPSKSDPKITQIFNWFLKLFWFHFGFQNGSPKHPKRHKIKKMSAHARKRRLFENKHLAYTKHYFPGSRVPKTPPKSTKVAPKVHPNHRAAATPATAAVHGWCWLWQVAEPRLLLIVQDWKHEQSASEHESIVNLPHVEIPCKKTVFF